MEKIGQVMKTGKSVQFKNIEDIITAYNSRGVPAFAIFQDKQFLFKYEGNDIDEGSNELQTMCNALRQSAAIYTLAVYETIPGRITNTTEYDGSFNFRFQDNTESYNQGSQMLRELNNKFDQVNKRLDELSQENESEPEPELSGLDKIAGVLGHPVVQQFLPAIIQMLGIKLIPDQQQPTPAAAIAGVKQAVQQPVNDFDISDELYQALCKMMIAKPDVEKSLIELGNLAENNPGKFCSLFQYMKFL